VSRLLKQPTHGSLLVICLVLPALVSADERTAERGTTSGVQAHADQPTPLAVDRYVYAYKGSALPPEDAAPYAAYTANDPAGEFNIERAAQFMDGVAVKWGAKHGCVTCHTNGHYLIAPARIFKGRPAANAVREFAEDWVRAWSDVGLPDTEIVVAPAAFLAINNVQMEGVLRPTTLEALDVAWSLQSAEGHWPNWVKCNWPPFEQDDHYGVTLMAIAMGMSPERYTAVDPARTGIAGMLAYLRSHEAEEVHHRAMMLWAGKFYDGLITDAQRTQWIEELLALQKSSGGWASGDLGRWRQRAPESGDIAALDPELLEREYPPVMIDPNGDGYGTGFVTFVLLQAGVPQSHPQIRKSIDWLESNQQADGKWFTNSLRNEVWTSNFLTHTGTVFALKALAEAM
jgi:squalene-hopene/tetraprenyl-beta-curcumene cyclase